MRSSPRPKFPTAAQQEELSRPLAARSGCCRRRYRGLSASTVSRAARPPEREREQPCGHGLKCLAHSTCSDADPHLCVEALASTRWQQEKRRAHNCEGHLHMETLSSAGRHLGGGRLAAGRWSLSKVTVEYSGTNAPSKPTGKGASQWGMPGTAAMGCCISSRGTSSGSHAPGFIGTKSGSQASRARDAVLPRERCTSNRSSSASERPAAAIELAIERCQPDRAHSPLAVLPRRPPVPRAPVCRRVMTRFVHQANLLSPYTYLGPGANGSSSVAATGARWPSAPQTSFCAGS